MDIFDRIASGFKQARLPSHKNNSKDVVEKAWEEHKSKHPEMAEFEGALDPQTGELSKSRIEKNKKEMGKTALYTEDNIIDDIGLGRVASSHSSLIRKVKREIERYEDRDFIKVSLEADYDGTDIVLRWDHKLVYDKRDMDEISSWWLDWTERGRLHSILNKVFQFVERNHNGLVERGTSDISEGVYRIRIH